MALNLEEIEWTAEGALVIIRRSKIDQEGLGRKVGIPRGEVASPVASLETWLEAAGITEGAVLSACGFFMRAVAMAFAGDRECDTQFLTPEHRLDQITIENAIGNFICYR